MKLALPLWIKVWLLLALNFALVAAIGAVWFFGRSERDWGSLATGPLGDRAAAIADGVADKLWSAPQEEAERILAEESAKLGVQLIWMRNDGLVLAGPSLPLPDLVRRELNHEGPLARAERNSGSKAGVESEEPSRREMRPGPGLAARGQAGRFLYQLPGGYYWFGLRLHPAPEVVERGEPPPRTTLLVRTNSLWALAKLLGIHLWVGVAGAALGVSVLFWMPFVRSTSRRLRGLESATGRIAEGHFETRTATGGDEIGLLGASINSMAQRLESHADLQKKFLGDVAHELGSPIGRLQVAVELLEQRAAPDLQPQVADVREEVQQMSELVGELLAFTRAGMRPRETELTSVPLAGLLAEVMQRENGEGRVVVSFPEGLAVRADAALLRRAVGNLVRNALRYGGSKVSVAASVKGAHVHLVVEDDGPGVPADALTRLGEPFFRPEHARTRETGGVGLGLTIVRSSVAACGGEVHFSNREPHGFRAEIWLLSA